MKQRRDDKERSRKKRIRRILGLRSKRELRLTPGFQSHEALWAVAKKLPTDFEPYGKRKRSDGPIIYEDCSCNCRWFHVLTGMRGQDWGVCANPKSPRAGLLTFEHMGCPQYEWDGREDDLETGSGKKAMKRFQDAEEELEALRQTKQSPRCCRLSDERAEAKVTDYGPEKREIGAQLLNAPMQGNRPPGTRPDRQRA